LRHHLKKRQEFADACVTLDGPASYDDLVVRFTDRIGCDARARELFADFHDGGVELEQHLAAVEPALDGECGRWREDAIQIAGLLAKARMTGKIIPCGAVTFERR
jgi:hypothetical protein